MSADSRGFLLSSGLRKVTMHDGRVVMRHVTGLTCTLAASEVQQIRGNARLSFEGAFDRIAASRGYKRVSEVSVFQDGGRTVDGATITPDISLMGLVEPLPGMAANKARGEG